MSIKQTSTSVPEIDILDHIYTMNPELQKEISWTIHGIDVIKEAKETISWAGYHASFQEHSIAVCHHCNSTTLYGESRFTCYGKTWNEYDKKTLQTS